MILPPVEKCLTAVWLKDQIDLRPCSTLPSPVTWPNLVLVAEGGVYVGLAVFRGLLVDAAQLFPLIGVQRQPGDVPVTLAKITELGLVQLLGQTEGHRQEFAKRLAALWAETERL